MTDEKKRDRIPKNYDIFVDAVYKLLHTNAYYQETAGDVKIGRAIDMNKLKNANRKKLEHADYVVSSEFLSNESFFAAIKEIISDILASVGRTRPRDQYYKSPEHVLSRLVFSSSKYKLYIANIFDHLHIQAVVNLTRKVYKMIYLQTDGSAKEKLHLVESWYSFLIKYILQDRYEEFVAITREKDYSYKPSFLAYIEKRKLQQRLYINILNRQYEKLPTALSEYVIFPFLTKKL